MINIWTSKRSGKKRELLSFIGYLHHCCRVKVPARQFLRCLIDLSCTVKSLDHHAHLSTEAIRDLDWWDYLLNDWNGKSFFLIGSWAPLPNFQISLDAASDVGCGAIFEN